MVLRAHAPAAAESVEGQELLEHRLGGAPRLRPPQGRQTGDEVVIGIGEARGDDHRGEGGRVESVGRIEHPQEIERPHLVGLSAPGR